MTAEVNVDDFGEGAVDFKKETEVIPDGFNVCRLVSYIELGRHIPVFNGKQQRYDTGKNAGKLKYPELMLHLVFEFTNAAYTAFPLTIRTSVPFGDLGNLMNKLSITKGIEEGWISRANALKSGFIKTLLAMQDAQKSESGTMSSFVGDVFGCTITHTEGKKADADGNAITYANMKTTSLVAPSFKNPVTQEITIMELPEAIGEYCPVFDWEEPTIEAWALVPEYLKKYIMKAEDYPGSPLDAMLAGYVEKHAEKEEESSTDKDSPVEPESSKEVPDDDIPF